MKKISTNKNKIISLLNNTSFCIICIFVATIIIFSNFIFSDKMLFSSDQMSGLDDKVFTKNSIEKHHQFPPLWVNTRLSGRPSVDALFGDVFYLPSHIINLLFSVPRAIGMKMVFHVFLAGLFFFLMLRKGFGISPFISLMCAVFYMLNPQFISHIYPGHDGKMYVIAWLPFIVWQLKLLMDRPCLLNMSLLALGVGMSILTSHIQMTYFVLWGAFLYWIFTAYLTLVKQKDFKKTVSLSLFFWGSICLGVGLGAIQLFPSFFYIRDGFSVRGVDRGFEFASSWSLHWPELLSLWVPEFVNTLDYYWGLNPFKLNSEYAGMMPLLLAILAIVLKPKNPWRIFWGIVALGAVMFALGAHTPVFHIAYAIIPGVKKFRAPSMIMFWFSFSTILLAALFLKDLLRGALRSMSRQQSATWRRGLMIAAGACLALTVLFSVQGVVRGIFAGDLLDQQKERIFELNFNNQFLPFLWLWCILTSGVLLLLRASIGNDKSISPNVVIVSILVIWCIDILRVDFFAAPNPRTHEHGFIRLINPQPYFYSDPALKPLLDEMHKEPFRCFSLPGALPQNGEGIHGLEGVGGFHDNELRWYREFRGDQQDRNFLFSLIGINSNGQPYLRAERLSEGNPFLNIANVRYLLVRNGNRLLTIRNRNALDRLSFVSGYMLIDSSKIIEYLSNGTADYRRNVLLTVKPELPDSFFYQTDSVYYDNSLFTEWIKYTPNYRKANIKAPKTGFIRISEVFYPGWEIRIDGKKVKYYRADLCWIAVPVSEGKHIIEMLPHSYYLKKFIPISFGVACFLLIYWLYAGVMFAINNRKNQKNENKA